MIPGDLRRLAVTQSQEKNHQLTLAWNNCNLNEDIFIPKLFSAKHDIHLFKFTAQNYIWLTCDFCRLEGGYCMQDGKTKDGNYFRTEHPECHVTSISHNIIKERRYEWISNSWGR